MSGLILKDMLVLKKTLNIYALFFAIYGYLAVAEGQISLMFTMVFIISVTVPMAAMSYDERHRWDRIVNTMPVTRKQVVISKYLLSFILTISSALVVQVVYIIDGTMPWADRIVYMIAMVLTAMFYQAVTTPLVIKFGSEKARVMVMAVFFAPLILVFAISKLPIFGSGGLTGFLAANISILPFIAVAAVAVTYIRSVILSIKIYENKDL